MKSKRVSKTSHQIPRHLLIAAILSLIASVCLGQSDQPPSDSAPPSPLDNQSPSVAMTFADGKSLALRSGKGRFPLVAANSGETVSIQVRISSASNGVAVARCLDGGALSTDADNITLDADGSGSFEFQVGTKPGLYRVVLSGGNAAAILQFWVLSDEPNSNPAVLQAH